MATGVTGAPNLNAHQTNNTHHAAPQGGPPQTHAAQGPRESSNVHTSGTTATLDRNPAHVASNPHGAAAVTHAQGNVAHNVTGGPVHGNEHGAGGGGAHAPGGHHEHTLDQTIVHRYHQADNTWAPFEVANEAPHLYHEFPGKNGAHGAGHGGAAGGAHGPNNAPAPTAEPAPAPAPAPAPKAPVSSEPPPLLREPVSEDMRLVAEAEMRAQHELNTARAANNAARAEGAAANTANTVRAETGATQALAAEANTAEAVGNTARTASTASKVLNVGGRVIGGAAGVVGLAVGPMQIGQGIKEATEATNAREGTSAGLQITSGLATTVSGGAGVVAAAGVTAAAPVAIGVGGVAAMADGVRDLVRNESRESVGSGATKVVGGGLMTAGAICCATGPGAVVGVPLMIAGGVVSGVGYLANETEVGRKVMGAIGDGARAVGTFVSDTASTIASGVSNAASSVWNAVTSWW